MTIFGTPISAFINTSKKKYKPSIGAMEIDLKINGNIMVIMIYDYFWVFRCKN